MENKIFTYVLGTDEFKLESKYLAKNGELAEIQLGKRRVIKSRWKIINFFRKLFGCEKKYTEWYTKWEYNGGNTDKKD